MMRIALLAAALILQDAPGGTRPPSPKPAQLGAIAGRIFSTSGSPAAGVRVSAVVAGASAQRDSVAMMGVVMTDDAGRYLFDEIPAGNYYIAVGRVDTPTYFPGTIDPATATIVTVVAGDALTGLDFRMLIPPPLKVSGRVNRTSNAAARPQAVARVRLTGPRSMQMQTGPDGAFEFPDVPPGEYELSVLPVDNTVAPVRIVVVDRDVKNVQLGIAAASIEVKVRVEQDGIAPRFQLLVTELENPANPQKAPGEARAMPYAAGGALSLQLQPGVYRVDAAGLPAGYTLKAMTAAAMDLMTGLLRVPSADPMTLTIDLGVSSPPPWSLVTGRVTARAGQSLAITRIELSGPALVAALAADVRPDGSFTFPRVPFGVYVARVSPSAGYFPKSVTIGPDDPSRIEIAPPSPKDIVGDFVKIQPGEFMMGCSPGDTECMPEESPAHKVRITKPFELGRFEVTQLQWETVMGSNPSQFKGEDRPVEELNEWKMVETFLEKLNALNDGYRYRVPTEAEWEYAARAGSTGPFSAAPETYIWNLQILARSGALNGVAINTILPGNGLTRPVGQMQPNPWGLFDMQGNVWEWTSDWYSGTYYADSPVEDPRGPASGPMRVMKGGSANTAPFTIRASARGNQPPINRTYIFGLRLAREPIASQQNAPARPQARGPAPPTQAAEVQGVAANGATSVSAVEPCTERRGSGPFGWTDPSWEGLVDRVVTIVDASVQSIAPGGRPVPVQSTEPVKPPLAAGDDFILSVSSVLKGPPSLQRIVVLQPRYGEIWDLRPGQRYILFLIEEDRSLDFSKYADARRYQPVFSASLCVESRKLRVVPSGGGVRQHFEGLSIEQGLTDILTRLAGQ